MLDVLRLAWHYTAHYRLRTLILVVCLSITFFLPLAVQVLTGYFQRMMVERAEQTPLVVGPAGSANDLVLATLYFKGRFAERMTMDHVRRLRQEAIATPVPLYLRYTAAGRPIVGTSLEYFTFRRLRCARGTLPQVLGDAVLGAAVARQLGLGPQDRLLSDQEKVYDISSAYPLSMRVTGVLEETGTADDQVIFTDLKTTWVIEGIGHGHADARSLADPTLIAGLSQSHMTMSGAVAPYNEITREQLPDFHFHGDPDTFPLTAVIVLPRDAKAATILKTRYEHAEGMQAVVPRDVVAAMMDIVFRVKRFFDATFGLVLVSTALLVGLVILLTLRIRAREFETLRKIGFSRTRMLGLQSAEAAILVTVSLGLALLLLAAVMWYVMHDRWLL